MVPGRRAAASRARGWGTRHDRLRNSVGKTSSLYMRVLIEPACYVYSKPYIRVPSLKSTKPYPEISGVGYESLPVRADRVCSLVLSVQFNVLSLLVIMKVVNPSDNL